jgi:NDP-sugar pyrophosphorylase family protein
MPISDQPILEVILRQLKHAGFDEIIISTGYLHELIQAYLSNVKDIGDITYVHEDRPLGTIGPLRLIENLADNFLLMNGDILTDIDYRALVASHQKNNVLATIATYQRDVNIDFGVIEHDRTRKIIGFREKPTEHFEVSMGINVFRKDVLRFVPGDTPFGFDQLICRLIEEDEGIYSYLHTGYWLDIGRPDDYARSIEEFEQYRDRFVR